MVDNEEGKSVDLTRVQCHTMWLTGNDAERVVTHLSRRRGFRSQCLIRCCAAVRSVVVPESGKPWSKLLGWFRDGTPCMQVIAPPNREVLWCLSPVPKSKTGMTVRYRRGRSQSAFCVVWVEVWNFGGWASALPVRHTTRPERVAHSGSCTHTTLDPIFRRARLCAHQFHWTVCCTVRFLAGPMHYHTAVAIRPTLGWLYVQGRWPLQATKALNPRPSTRVSLCPVAVQEWRSGRAHRHKGT